MGGGVVPLITGREVLPRLIPGIGVPALLLFRVAGRRLALPLQAVRNVAPVPLLQPLVAAPPFVEGFFDFQGEPVAAIRLDRLLGLGEDNLGIYTPLLVLGGAARGLALHVAKIDQVIQAEAAAIQPIGPDETLNASVVGRISDGGETIYLLSANELLLEAEREKLAAHAALMRRRLDALDGEGRLAQ